ncbi:uncharacterized protein LOC142233682 [Haematobia irritans]|uniref:uncharacterized protein LOC142233682 n=1 Tax=Haematobia irritans TaxID=7368 RepID=UPI003F5044D6
MTFSLKGNDDKFTILLNSQSDIDQQLIEFKNVCQQHARHHRKRCKGRYYRLALMARLERHSTPEEIQRLLKSDARTFLLDAIRNEPKDIESITSMINSTISSLQTADQSTQMAIGLALEITGDCCRIGRIRNNCSIFMENNDIIILTTDIAYKYSGFKEICYAINLKYYLPSVSINDQIKIGQEVYGRITKKLKNGIALHIEKPGIINSYEYIELPAQCQLLDLQTIPQFFLQDLEMAAKIQADFIVIPNIRCKLFVKLLKRHLKNNSRLKLIGSINFNNGCYTTLDILAIVKLLDFILMSNIFNINESLYSYVCQEVIPIVKSLKKPIIASIPLENYNDFSLFKNHELLWKIDCILIEKSQQCNKYPLIVKKLLPIKSSGGIFGQNTVSPRNIQTSYQSIVNCIIRTINFIECRAIVIHSKCEAAALALSRVEIYCPVYVILRLDNIEIDNEEERQCRLQLAKVWNLRRNLYPIVFSKDMNFCGYKPINIGIEYIRAKGCIETGDFIITIEVKEDDDEQPKQDVIVTRAYYLPPIMHGEEFKC